MTFPMVRERVERGELCLHGWYYVIEEGRVLGLETEQRGVPAALVGSQRREVSGQATRPPVRPRGESAARRRGAQLAPLTDW